MTETKTLIFDLEANGLLKQATKVHCIALCDATSGDVWSYGPDAITKGLEELYNADVIVAHNGTSYDLPLLKKLYRWNRRPATRLIDTLCVARLLRPNVKEDDYTRLDWDRKLIGSHSLRAWGLRLGELKDDYKGPWDEWSQEMQDYCEQDVRVTLRLLNHLRPWEYPPVPLEIEHQAAHICHLMWEEGWTFNTKAAQELYVKLMEQKDQLEKQLVEKFGEWEEVDKVLIPKRDNKKLGYKTGVAVTKMKTVVFNPGSRVHIEKKLRETGWEPTEFTDSGRAKLDESILERIDRPEAKLLVDYLVIQKRLGMLGDGDGSWLRLVEADGRIHGTINPNGCVSGRATHRNPNISQVPANRAIYGKDCRALFGVPEGWKLVGADMAGLELRTFAHYLSAFDDGAYAKVVTEGDVHSHNQKLAGVDTRDKAKTFIYALLYGAGNGKLGTIIGGTEKQGRILRERFQVQMPAYSELLAQTVKNVATDRGYIRALDGRSLYIRSQHSALNTLLQGAGAILCKKWLIDFFEYMTNSGYTHGYGGDFVVSGFIHDEIQVACKAEYAKLVGDTLVHCAKHAGDSFDFKVPLASEYRIGNNWSETH